MKDLGISGLQAFVNATVTQARSVGGQAGLKYFNEKMGGRDAWPCGFSRVIVKVKGSTKLGRALLEAGFRKDYGGGLCKDFSGNIAQCMDVGVESNQAALEVLRTQLDLVGYVTSRMD